MTDDEPPPGTDGRTLRRLATRRRIVEATVDLHTTVGPARTTVSAIAERAGVQRHTVYAHFADDDELLQACSGLWVQRNPFPDLAAWEAIADPRRRARVALEEVYAYWERTAGDVEVLLRDADEVPGMARAREEWNALLDAAAADLVRGRGLRGAALRRARATARLAVDVTGWRRLTAQGGLGRREAARLMARLIDEAGAPADPSS